MLVSYSEWTCFQNLVHEHFTVLKKT